jgi:uncharacterized protein (TIGR00369 family)
MNTHPLIQAYNASNAFGQLLGMTFNILSPGNIVYSLRVTAEHLATPLAAHGGCIGALVDATLGVTALSVVCENNQVVSTIEYKVNFLAPALCNDELDARGKIIQQGRRILVVQCEVLAKNRNVMVAQAMGTFNAYDAAKAGY